MPRLHSKRGPMHEINVVPYVDVTLVLLVIFMVTAPLVTPGVIELPSVGKASAPRIAPIEIVIAEDRSVTLRERDLAGKVLSEKPVARGEIAKFIKDPKTPVLIAGDKNVKYEAVLQLMDELRAQGVERVGLQVKPGLKPSQ
jgi:biopolymer transport protein TolR